MSSENDEDLAQRLTTSSLDCQPCRFTGATAAFAIGTYILYHTRGGFFANQPIQKLCMRIIAAGAYYMAAARFIYLPPFTHLSPTYHRDERQRQS
uniref:DUF4536 domain-containing protein n=1 Tax=Parascaris univalens TaxID=6257 RepID=A0A915ADD1_PARUN